MKNIYFLITKWTGYLLAFIGIFFAFNKINTNVPIAIEKLVKIGIIPLTLCAFLWHTVFAGNIIHSKNHFFENEAGGANLAFGLVLIISYIFNFNLDAVLSILMCFSIYIFIAGLCKLKYSTLNSSILSFILSITILYFVYKGFVYQKIDLN
tara:strand:- start:85 stop:540 length:456 start_codon:yes stop_codon:yes gene_type:complete